MSNFPKNIQDASERELYQWINEHHVSLGGPASDELTRRSLDQLRKATEDGSRFTDRFNKLNLILAFVMLFLAFTQVMIAIISETIKTLNGWGPAVGMAAFGVILMIVFRVVARDLLKE